MCVICVKYKHGAKATGRGMWTLVDFYRESQAKSSVAPTKGRVMGWEDFEGKHSDCLSPAQELSPPHSPEGQTQLHPAVGTQSSWSPVWGGATHTLPSHTTSRTGLTWRVLRTPFKRQHWWNPSSATSWQVTALIRASVSLGCLGALTRGRARPSVSHA